MHTRSRIAFSAAALLASAVWPQAQAADTKAVLLNYANIAQAKYEDSLVTAQVLQKAVKGLTSSPSAVTLSAAKKAWLAARVPYQQTEVYRFGNAIVDEWEGKVNAWPLDEGLIDYVATSYGGDSDENNLYTANIISNAKIKINGKAVDAAEITPNFLAETLHEAGGVEANVATGYHAIEFLLWGQDLNGTKAGAGNRPHTDFDVTNCTGGNCARRVQYLQSATKLLVADLNDMVANWVAGGAARKAAEEGETGLATILTGMGSLSYGELAGERMKLGLLLHDPEEEHDCFSDNTHNSHLYDAVGIRNVYNGTYKRIDGSKVKGASLADLVSKANPALAKELSGKLDATISAMKVMVKRAEGGESYDQQIAEGNTQGNAIVQKAIDGLIDQTKSIERVIAALDLGKLELEGSDSLDEPGAVFK